MIPTLSWKTPTLSLRVLVRVFWARNSQREGRSLPREGRGPLFQKAIGISVGFSTETTGSLRNPEKRRTQSYEHIRRVSSCGLAPYQITCVCFGFTTAQLRCITIVKYNIKISKDFLYVHKAPPVFFNH